MNEQLRQQIIQRLERDYLFRAPRNSGQWMTHGKCPSCGQTELYISHAKPWVARCGRMNKCGAELHIRDVYADLFEDWSARFPKVPENPNATADAYLREMRGFDLEKIAGWYTQDSYYNPELQLGSTTVRFELPGIGYWERIIDKPWRFGKRKATFRGDYGGTWWQPPSLSLLGHTELWIVEGIFDAIALLHAGQPAVSTLSCNNYPELALSALAEQCADNNVPRPKLIWAYDGDQAGKGFTRKFSARARDAGWVCGAAQPRAGGAKKRDWNDLWIADALGEDERQDYLYLGSLLIAPTPAAKSALMYSRNGWQSFSFDHDNRMYWFKLDLERYGKSRDTLRDDYPDMPEQELIERALAESQTVTEICNCMPEPLYYMRNEITDESWYYFRLRFPHDGMAVKGTFTAGQLAAPAEFKKRILHLAAGAIWTGNATQLDKLLSRWVEGIRVVQTIDYSGYSLEHRAYVYNDVAVVDGKVVPQNDEDFFEAGKLAIKSLQKSLRLHINHDLKKYSPQDWWPRLHTCYGARGTLMLATFVASMVAEQVRERFESLPFVELVGEPGAGKSTLIEFLWKLFGREQYEGFDPMKGTTVGFMRSMAQVSNLPVVLIESDREDDSDGTRGRPKTQFDWDSLKSLYNGGSLRTSGVKSAGNDTYEPQFRASLIISQNAPVAASPAIMERIIHIWLDKSNQTESGREAALELSRMSARDVSGFLLKTAMAEASILQLMESRLRGYERAIAQAGSRNLRIQKNHAQLMVMVDALEGLLPITSQQIDEAKSALVDMALAREQSLRRDHPMVELFWEVYDYLDGGDDADCDAMLNHSRDTGLIAINLNHFAQLAAERKQVIPSLTDLKRILPTSKRHKLIDKNRAVNSAIHARHNVNIGVHGRKLPSTVKCWVFEGGEK